MKKLDRQPRNFFGDRVRDESALRWLIVKWFGHEKPAIEHRRPTSTGTVYRRNGWSGAVVRGEIVSVHDTAADAMRSLGK